MLNIGAQFHGTWSELSDSDRARILDALVDAGLTWVRIDIGWSMIQPKARSAYDLWGVQLVDSVFQMAHKRGLGILATFWRTPEWASGKTERNVFPRSHIDYANAIEWAAKRWPQVAAWEIWNEPNAVEFLDPPDPAKYAELLKAAYPAVKRGNPRALVVFGGPMFVDTDWIARVYAAGARNAFDVMAVHPYQGNAAKPPSDPAKGKRERLLHTDALIALMRGHGDSRPIWFTEWGWSSHENTAATPVWFLGVDEGTQGRYVTEALELIRLRYPQVTHIFWYTSRDLETGNVHQDNRGLMRKDFSAKPALTAMSAFIARHNVVQISAHDHSRNALDDG